MYKSGNFALQKVQILQQQAAAAIFLTRPLRLVSSLVDGG
jgi:hypothetical protein